MRSLRSCNRRRRYRAAYDRIWDKLVVGFARLGVTCMADLENLR